MRRDSGTGEAAPGIEQSVLLSVLTGLAGLSALLLGWQAVSPSPFRGFGITIDRLSTPLTLLVAVIGAVTFRFSTRYLAGNNRQRRFLRLLAFTVISAYVLMCATNMLLLFVAWSLTSLGLHGLLTIYEDRSEARRPARKKFLISRLGDVALIGATILIWRGWGTLDLHEFLAGVVAAKNADASVGVIGVLVAIAALTKSAQFPFHSWLPETMEAPTPVSALMHAGIINAGGALLLRFAPLIVRVPEVPLVLSLVGTFTFTIGMLAMWAQVKVKRTLAWSTVGQMGFMMVQLGLGAFPVAAMHIIGHGCYKAWSFLRSGDLPAAAPAPAAPARAICLAAIGTVLSVPVLAFAAWLVGFTPLHSPGEFALSVILAISIGQLWVGVLGRPTHDPSQFSKQIVVVAASSVAAAVGAFALYRGAAAFLAPVLGNISAPTGPLAWMAAAIPVTALAVLLVIHASFPLLGRTRAGRAFYVHCLNGFYFGAIADRIVDAVWSRPRFPVTGALHA